MKREESNKLSSARSMLAKMAANGIRTHGRTNQTTWLVRAWVRIPFAAIFADQLMIWSSLFHRLLMNLVSPNYDLVARASAI